MTTHIPLGKASAEWRESAASLALFPTTGADGQVRLARATGGLYYWTGAAWALVTASTGAITMNDLNAITDGSAAVAGDIGEILSASVGAATTVGVGATGVYGAVTSLALTAGNWIIDGVIAFNENGATLTTSLSAGLSDSPTGATLGTFDAAVHNNLISGASDLIVPVPQKIVNIAAGTTYYLNSRFFYTAGTPRHYGFLRGRRFR